MKITIESIGSTSEDIVEIAHELHAAIRAASFLPEAIVAHLVAIEFDHNHRCMVDSDDGDVLDELIRRLGSAFDQPFPDRVQLDANGEA